MRKVYSLLIILLFISTIISAQNCDYQLDAGEDLTICESGQVQVSATFSTQPLSVAWMPTALFDNPNGLTTFVDITAPTTLQLTVSVLSEVNLVNNGDFSLGDIGFTSDYIYGTGGGVGLLSNEGQYAIDNNAGNTHNHFSNCNDHTGGGNMMVVNASGLPNNIWCQTITVEANSTYDFSAWITSVTDENPAELQFSINGTLLGDVFNASSSACFWQQFAAQWMSANVVNAEICIVNSNLTPSGNDFALDDIVFQQICEFTDEVIIDINPANANWSNPMLLCEGDDSQLMDNWLTPAATPNGTWTINGQPATEFSPQILGAGLYSITYLADNGDCTTEITQGIVLASFLTAGNGENTELCHNENQIITLTNLLSNEDLGGTWTETSITPSTGNAFDTNNGTFTTDEQIPGIYTFIYSQNNIAPCLSATAEVNITIYELPAADVSVNQSLDCTIAEVLIGDSNANMNYIYQWFDENNLPLGNFSTQNVMEAGNYLLMVTDPETGCQNSDEALVVSNVSLITVSAQSTAVSCNADDDGEININTANGGTGPYVYSLDGENFVSSPIFDNLTAGTYTVTAMDIFGCTGENTISVAMSSVEILFETAVTPVICGIANSGQITISNTSGGTGIYRYSIDGVNFSSSPIFTDLTAGNYTITVVDAIGCIGEGTVEILPNNDLELSLMSNGIGNPPILSLGDNIDLNIVTNIAFEDIISIIWSPIQANCINCAQINVSPSNSTVYEVTIIDNKGCTATASLHVIIDKSYSFYIPNAFSPNDDGFNDIFYIHSGNKMHHVLQMTIANRWGDIVYQQKNFTTNTASGAWDGKFNGKRLNPGVYIYVAEIEIGDKTIIESGEITLVY